MVLEHTHKSLVSSFFSPEGAANHWYDQIMGESVICGNWFFHMSGLYSFALSSIYGITLFSMSDYSDTNLLDAIVDNRAANATLYSWQVGTRFFDGRILESQSHFTSLHFSLRFECSRNRRTCRGMT